MATANTRRSNQADSQGDFYTTDPRALPALLKEINFEGNVLDAGCGNGVFAKHLIKTGHETSAIDLFDRGYGVTGIDFMEQKGPFENIVTNPPFKDRQQSLTIYDWVQHALKIATKKVAVFARINFLESADRFELFQDFKPDFIFTFANRMTCSKDGKEQNGSSAVFYAWFVWDLEKERPEFTKQKVIYG